MAETRNLDTFEQIARSKFTFIQTRLTDLLPELAQTTFFKFDENDSSASLITPSHQANVAAGRLKYKHRGDTHIQAVFVEGLVFFDPSSNLVRFPIFLPEKQDIRRVGSILVCSDGATMMQIQSYSNHLVEALLTKTFNSQDLTKTDMDLARLEERLEKKKSVISEQTYQKIQSEMFQCTHHWKNPPRKNNPDIQPYIQTLNEWLDQLPENAPKENAPKEKAPFSSTETYKALQLLLFIVPVCTLIGWFIGGFLSEGVLKISLSEGMKIGCLFGIVAGCTIWSAVCWFTFECGKNKLQPAGEDLSSPWPSTNNFTLEKDKQFQPEILGKGNQVRAEEWLQERANDSIKTINPTQ
jgi:hypothetical protein